MININIPENYAPYLDYAPLFLVSIASAVISTPIVGYIARKLKVLGLPPSMLPGKRTSDRRRLEKPPTPLLGGIAVLIPFFILVFLTIAPSPELTALVIAVSILTFMGILDDKYELSGGVQITAMIIAAAFLAVSTIDLTSTGNPFGAAIPLDAAVIRDTVLGFPISIVLPGDILLFAWILICTIAVKISSGTDGLMEGNTFIASIIFFLLSVRFQYTETATASIILAGLLLGFLVFNFYPAKIRSGASGKSTYGFILAVLSLQSGAKMATAILILLVPIADFFIVVIRRYIVHRPLNPLLLLTISDKTHLHHKLLDFGLSERRVAYIEYVITALLGAIALAISGTMKAFLFVGVAAVVAAFIVGLPIVGRRRKPGKPEEPPTPEARFSY